MSDRQVFYDTPVQADAPILRPKIYSDKIRELGDAIADLSPEEAREMAEYLARMGMQ